jgi:hypothetical protein
MRSGNGEEGSMAVYYRATDEKSFGPDSDERVLLQMEVNGGTTEEEEVSI